MMQDEVLTTLLNPPPEMKAPTSGMPVVPPTVVTLSSVSASHHNPRTNEHSLGTGGRK